MTWILAQSLSLIGKSWKFIDETDHLSPDTKWQVERVLDGLEPASILFLHGKMFPLWIRFRNSGALPVVSSSRDGSRLVAFLKGRLGYQQVLRGSSSSGGSEVLRRMEQALASSSIMVTPDGPRGPAGEVKPGGIVAAHRSKRDLLLVDWSAARTIRFSSWDRMEIPFPFSKVYIRYCIEKPTSINNSIQYTRTWFLEESSTSDPRTTERGLS